MLSKIRYYVNSQILTNLYYSLIYPFLIYGILAWGNTYSTTIQPLFVLQKRAIRIISFAKFDKHSAPLFLKLYIIKMFDLVNFQISIFMFKLHNNLLPKIFQDFFIPVNQVHSYNTRLACKKAYYLPNPRTNYGIFNIRFQGTKIWNDIQDDLKNLSLNRFKSEIKKGFFRNYR